MADNRNTYDAIIIGAGIIGCAVALSLTRRGFRTLNVDSYASPGYGATSFSAAIIRPYYSTRDGTLLALEGHHHWANWADYIRHAAAETLRYNQCGCLVLEAAENQRLRKTREILNLVGVPFDNIAGDALQDVLPGADLRQFAPPRRVDDALFGETDHTTIGGAIFCPTGGYVTDPQLACRQIAQAVVLEGGVFRYTDTVVAIARQAGRVTGVTLQKGGALAAPVVVNAAGPYSATINAMAGAANPAQIATRPLRQEVAHVAMPRANGKASLGCVLTDADCGVYMRPEGEAHLLIGSLEPACDTLDYVQPDDGRDGLTEQWTNQVWRAALRFPTLPIPNAAQGYAALYDVSDDWIPVYDRTDLPGFFTAIGTSGNQFKNAPVVGDIMAAIIDNAAHDERPTELALPYTGQTLRLEPFSRLRRKHADSSYSVLG